MRIELETESNIEKGKILKLHNLKSLGRIMLLIVDAKPNEKPAHIDVNAQELKKAIEALA